MSPTHRQERARSMKTLYIVRHAKAVSRDLGLPDIERTLSKRGQHDAQIMAEYAHTHGPIPDLLISSPAPRAFEAARAFAHVYDYPVARIRTYTCLYDDTQTNSLLPILQDLDDAFRTVMVIGHNPLCSDSVHDLAPSCRQAMPPGAVACIQFHVLSWGEVAPGRGAAVWCHDPKRPLSTPKAPLPIHALQSPAPQTFQSSASFDANQFANDLRTIYTIRTEPKRQRHLTYFDTFDWRLYNQSLTLQWEAPYLRLHALSDDHQLAREILTEAPTFAGELPAGALRQPLEKVTDIRALQPLFDCTSQYETWRLLNPDDKTVVRLVIEHHTCANSQGRTPTLIRVCLKPLKGYAQDAEHVQQWLLARGFMPVDAPLYAPALAALNITPNHYSAKPQFHLAPDMPAVAAVRSILRFLFNVMRQNEAGLLDDIDTEFLHDYRVASRRARSAVGQFKGVFDESTTLRLKQDLASLGAMTNRVRDLDVYLLRQSDYRDKLPADYREAIDPLFDRLKRDRKQAFHRLKRKLRAKAYTELMTRWETFLNAEPVSTTAPHATQPMRKVAQKRLAKLSRRELETGHLLLTAEDDERMHDLRIDCKKLRYVLEFTSSLFPPSAVAPVIKHLRKLQDVLGEFHDCCVQQETLETDAAQFVESEATHQAIAHLIDVLEREKKACKAAFAERFTAFAASLDGAHRPWKQKV